MHMCIVPSQQVCPTLLPPHLIARTTCIVRLHNTVKHQQISFINPLVIGIIMLEFLMWFNSLHVKVAGDVHIVAVSGKVVPLVHINLVLLIGYNLSYCALHHFSDTSI